MQPLLTSLSPCTRPFPNPAAKAAATFSRPAVTLSPPRLPTRTPITHSTLSPQPPDPVAPALTGNSRGGDQGIGNKETGLPSPPICLTALRQAPFLGLKVRQLLVSPLLTAQSSCPSENSPFRWRFAETFPTVAHDSEAVFFCGEGSGRGLSLRHEAALAGL